MKKVFAIVLALVLMLCQFAGCARANKDPFDLYKEVIGQTREEAMKTLGMTEEDIESESAYHITFSKAVPALGYDDAVLMLHYDMQTEEPLVNDFVLDMLYSDDAAETAEVAKDLLAKLTEAYGEPDAYPGLDRWRIADNEDAAAALETEGGTWEVWHPTDGSEYGDYGAGTDGTTLSLSVHKGSIRAGDNFIVCITYLLYKMP